MGDVVAVVYRKRDCPGCRSLRDDHGRFPIGFCDHDPRIRQPCLLRQQRDRFVAAQRRQAAYLVKVAG